MTEHSKVLALHITCVVVIATCFALSATVFKDTPAVAQILTGAALWLYGKLGFKPAKSVFERLVQTLDPSEVVQIMSSRPPAPSRGGVYPAAGRPPLVAPVPAGKKSVEP